MAEARGRGPEASTLERSFVAWQRDMVQKADAAPA
jgi:hypothetical protein